MYVGLSSAYSYSSLPDIIDVRSPAFATYDAGPTADPCIILASADSENSGSRNHLRPQTFTRNSAMSVDILSTAAQLYEKSQFTMVEIGEWP